MQFTGRDVVIQFLQIIPKFYQIILFQFAGFQLFQNTLDILFFELENLLIDSLQTVLQFLDIRTVLIQSIHGFLGFIVSHHDLNDIIRAGSSCNTVYQLFSGHDQKLSFLYIRNFAQFIFQRQNSIVHFVQTFLQSRFVFSVRKQCNLQISNSNFCCNFLNVVTVKFLAVRRFFLNLLQGIFGFCNGRLCFFVCNFTFQRCNILFYNTQAIRQACFQFVVLNRVYLVFCQCNLTVDIFEAIQRKIFVRSKRIIGRFYSFYCLICCFCRRFCIFAVFQLRFCCFVLWFHLIQLALKIVQFVLKTADATVQFFPHSAHKPCIFIIFILF